MSDCCKFLYKKQNKKGLLLVTATRLASTTHPGETSTQENIKIHIVQDRQGRALSPPHPPVENSLHPNPVPLSVLLPEAMPQLEGGAQGGGQRCPPTPPGALDSSLNANLQA